MKDSQHTDLKSDPTLTKLQAAASDLATQETQLMDQLESIQEKRKSLETVIDLFSETDIAITEPAPKAPEASVTEVKTPPPPSPSSPPLKPAKTAKKSKPKSTKRDS
ncbi:MAG: hypothetical protein F6K19_32480, partial [Cyanothece sp. SIO1E1]|nr:hypothetical protein [Cyanothece sp. SIO1E1]